LKQLQLIQILGVNAPGPADVERAAPKSSRINSGGGRAMQLQAAASEANTGFDFRKGGDLRSSALYLVVTLTSVRRGKLGKTRRPCIHARQKPGGNTVVEFNGHGNNRSEVRNGVAYGVRAGDVMVRIDPDEVTPLKREAQSAEYLSKPAKRGD